MKPIKYIVFSLFVSACHPVMALGYPVSLNIDYQCMNDCMAKGYMYGYCQKVCSY
jgi:hypothetical protein